MLAFVFGNVVLFATIFLMRGQAWPRLVLVIVTAGVLKISLPLCWFFLGVDGLVHDGAPLVVAGLWRAREAAVPLAAEKPVAA